MTRLTARDYDGCEAIIHRAGHRGSDPEAGKPCPIDLKNSLIATDDTMIRVEQNDKWTAQGARHLTLESVDSVSDNVLIGPPLGSLNRPLCCRMLHWPRASRTRTRDTICANSAGDERAGSDDRRRSKTGETTNSHAQVHRGNLASRS